MVIAAQRVARHVGAVTIVQGGPGFSVVLVAVIHADRDHPHRARQQFIRPCAQRAVARHPLHRAVQALAQPIGQVRLVFAQIDAGHAAALEAVHARDRTDAFGGTGQMDGGGQGNGGHGLGGNGAWGGRGKAAPGRQV